MNVPRQHFFKIYKEVKTILGVEMKDFSMALLFLDVKPKSLMRLPQKLTQFTAE